MIGEFLVNWIAFTPIFSLPLLLASLGLIINERAGVMNLSAEGMMLVGALAGVAFYFETGQSPWLGLLMSGVAGVALAFVFAVLVVTIRVSQVVVGIALVFFASGLTGLVGTGWTEKAVTGFKGLDMGPLSTIPGIGPIFFHQDIVVYLAIPLFILVWRFLFHSVTGMKLRSVGENPQAADAAGIDVEQYRFLAVLAGGLFCGLAGGYLSLRASEIWVEDMTAGRGWIAVALVIFSRWRPGRALLGALLFGGIEALIPRLQAAGATVPTFILQMLPYLATFAVLIYVALTTRLGTSSGPAALGTPYVREDRR